MSDSFLDSLPGPITEPTFVCSSCQDRGVILAERPYPGDGDHTYMSARPCLSCRLGECMTRRFEADARNPMYSRRFDTALQRAAYRQHNERKPGMRKAGDLGGIDDDTAGDRPTARRGSRQAANTGGESERATSSLRRMQTQVNPMVKGIQTLDRVKIAGQRDPLGWLVKDDYRTLLLDTIGEWVGRKRSDS